MIKAAGIAKVAGTDQRIIKNLYRENQLTKNLRKCK
jgi:hypothetical protein